MVALHVISTNIMAPTQKRLATSVLGDAMFVQLTKTGVKLDTFVSSA
jgi:hypothetical protein